MRGSDFTSGGQRQKVLTPTSRLAWPSEPIISVAFGAMQMMRVGAGCDAAGVAGEVGLQPASARVHARTVAGIGVWVKDGLTGRSGEGFGWRPNR